jgi:hypothetical protein
MVRDAARFAALARLGHDLVELHLGERPPPDAARPRFFDGGDRRVLRVGEQGRALVEIAPGRGRLHINDVSYFDPVPRPTFRQRIGGYQVCYKWLNDRRLAHRQLSDDEVDAYCAIVAALRQTRTLMTLVDRLVRPLL